MVGGKPRGVVLGDGPTQLERGKANAPPLLGRERRRRLLRELEGGEHEALAVRRELRAQRPPVRVRDEGDVDVGGAVAGERRRRRLLRAERIRRGVHDDRVRTLRGADEEVATESKVFHQSSDGILSVVFRRQRALRADVFLRGFLLQRTGRGGCARIDDVYAHAIVVSDARGIMERAVVVFELVRLLFGGVTVRAALHRRVQAKARRRGVQGVGDRLSLGEIGVLVRFERVGIHGGRHVGQDAPELVVL